MAQKLIILSDGTGNSAAKLFKTNVWKLYEALDLTPSSNQIALYDDGVGTSRFKPWALLTGAFGFGLKRNVLKMYVFLSRHYHGQIEAQKRSLGQGATATLPEIYGFGFSRGAFTVRVLAGLVIRQGLVPQAPESQMRRMALLSYRAYRKDCFHTKTRIEAPFRIIRDAIADIVNRLWWHLDYDPRRKTQDGWPQADGGNMNTGGVKIRFLGVWDTVAAYGMPIEELRIAIDKLIFPLTFTNTELLKEVQTGCHALSIDEERSSFAPLLWDHTEDARLKQVWFAGVHANAGGGYPDDSLSSVPLAWMAFNAKDNGLLFHQQALNEIRGRATPFGKMYDSRSGVGAFYRYQPRQVCSSAGGRPVSAPPVLHESVVFRMATGFQGYAPIALPRDVRVVDKDGNLQDFAQFRSTGAGQRLLGTSAALAGTTDLRLASMVASLNPPRDTDLIKAAVFRRRVTYFGTLIPALMLVAFPILGPIFPKSPQLDPDWVQTLGELGKIVASVTPWYLAPWQKAIAQNPFVALVLGAVAALFYWRGSALRTLIAERARAAWNMGHNPPSKAAGFSDRIALLLLASSPANRAWAFTAKKLFPTLVILLALAVPIVLFDRMAFWLQATSGKICGSDAPFKDLRSVTDKWQDMSFSADNPCVATPYRVRKDHRYEIKLALDRATEWKDLDIKADLAGLNLEGVDRFRRFMMAVGVPFRRHWGERWFVPIARIGKHGSEEYVLEPANVETGTNPRWDMISVIQPNKNDQLFLFVNDAYAGLVPLAWMESVANSATGPWSRHLYGNNRGVIKAQIRREPAASD